MFSPRAEPIYLDYAATTPVDPAVRAAMLPFLSDEAFGNPSSVHTFGQAGRRAIDRRRDTLASAIGAQAGEIYFTSGGTEADNTALIGVLLAGRERGRDHLVTTTIEHHAVLDCARFAQRRARLPRHVRSLRRPTAWWTRTRSAKPFRTKPRSCR
jgi:cysteine desulfurase